MGHGFILLTLYKGMHGHLKIVSNLEFSGFSLRPRQSLGDFVCFSFPDHKAFESSDSPVSIY